MVKNIKKYKRESEAIWVAEAMRSETRRVLRSKPKKHKEDEEDIENKEEFEEKEKEERPFFPEYQLDLVRAAFKAAKSEGKEIPLHNPNLKYTAKDVGRVIRVLERAGLEARLGYIA
ncbi:MAG: hypothetical protein QW666_03165, partial [Candidatus Woesearchaeota archaeon]